MYNNKFYEIPRRFGSERHDNADGAVTFNNKDNVDFELTTDALGSVYLHPVHPQPYRSKYDMMAKLNAVSENDVYKYYGRKLATLYNKMNELSGYREFVCPCDEFFELERQVYEVKRECDFEFTSLLIDSLPSNCTFIMDDNTELAKTKNISNSAFNKLIWGIYPEEMIRIAAKFKNNSCDLGYLQHSYGFNHKAYVVFSVLGTNVNPQYKQDLLMLCSGHADDAIMKYNEEVNPDTSFKGQNLSSDDFIALISNVRYNHDPLMTVFYKDKLNFDASLTYGNMAEACRAICVAESVGALGSSAERFELNFSNLLDDVSRNVESGMIYDGKADVLCHYYEGLIRSGSVEPTQIVPPLQEEPMLEMDNDMAKD